MFFTYLLNVSEVILISLNMTILNSYFELEKLTVSVLKFNSTTLVFHRFHKSLKLHNKIISNT